MEVSIAKKINQILKHGLIYGLTSSLQSLLGFILLPILTSYYTTEEFGVYSLLLIMGSFASAVFYLGASSALGRYYYEEDSQKYRGDIISSAIQITGFGAILLIVLSTLFSDYISSIAFNTEVYSLHVRLAFYGVAFTFLLNLLTLVLRYDNLSRIFFMISIFGVVLNFLITFILLAKYDYGIKAPLIGFLSANVTCFLLLSLYIRKYLSFNLNLKYLKVLLKFGIPTLISGLLFYILDLADRFIIKSLLSTASVGIYSLGYKIGSLINVVLIMPFGLIWAPMRMKNANNLNATRILMVKVTSYFFITGFIIILMAMLFSRNLMPIFFKKKEFQESVQIVPIIIIGIFLFGLQNILDFGINYYKKLHYYIITSIIGIIFNVVVNYTFIPIFGYKAAAYGTMFTYLLTTTLIFLFSSRFFKVSLEWRRLAIPTLALVLILFAFNFYPYFFDSLMWSIAMFFLTLFLLYKFWLTNNERLTINRILTIK
ncbi:MAG: oligosaccharide flippase family protein [Candidatus Pedobacter colombiensis]|uniref:Oligosaccharide flippase family protein n=1 Tax=Candidatus Pedobacter colombiensis TaxID=3121371 RepID=A0AAJ5W8Q6_9SPHI|nr:oligosaccharide flippase family protein [Pedobacter sp.]WEK19655.1 MAG: oligosaccharide flippase family protein [Pedobacter sp.]